MDTPDDRYPDIFVASDMLPESEINEDLDADVRRDIRVHYVSMIDEALDLALTAAAHEKSG